MSILTGPWRGTVQRPASRLAPVLLLGGASLMFVVDLATPRGIADGYLYLVLVALGTQLLRSRELSLLAIVCCVLIALGGWFSPPGAEASVTSLNRLIAICALGLVTAFHFARRRAERVEAVAEERFQDFVENAPVAMHWAGSDGRILWANAAELALLGYAPNEYIGHHVGEFHADPRAADDILARLRANIALHDYEARLRCRDGSVRDVLISSNVYFRNGEFVHTRCFTRDITLQKAAERARTESDARFRELADAAPVMIWMSDAERRCVYLNRNWLEFTGRPIEAGLGTGWYDAIHPEDRDRCWTAFAVAYARREPCSIEYRMRNAGGEYRWVRDHGLPRLSASGELLGFVGSAYDVTDLKEAAALLRRANESLEERVAQRTAERHAAAAQYRELVESLDAIVWRCDASTMRFTFVSPQAERLLGYPPAEWIADPEFFAHHLHPEDRERVIAFCADRTRALQHHDMEYRMLAADGRVVWVRDMVHVSARDGKPVELIGVMLDITDRRRAEEALRRSEERFRSLTELLADWYWETDEQHRLTMASERDLFDVRACLGKTRWEHGYYVATEEEWAAHRAMLDRHEPFKDLMFRMRADDGTTHFVLISGLPFFDDQGRFAGYRGTVKDITEQRRIEQEARRYAEQLQALSRRLVDAQERERKDLARELHDRVGQSMSALKINLEILRAQMANGPAHLDTYRMDDSIQLVEQTVDALANLTSELRPPMLDDYGLIAALRWYASLFERRTGIEVVISPASESAPRLTGEAESALFRIAQEAMTNVAKHAGARQIQVTLRQDERRVSLQIVDDGQGFDPGEAQQRRTRASWGMITMRERAQAVGAQFRLETAPGRGTRIVVELPGDALI